MSDDDLDYTGPCPGQIYDDRFDLGWECDLREGHDGPHGCTVKATIAPDPFVYPGVPVRLSWAYEVDPAYQRGLAEYRKEEAASKPSATEANDA
jgi:hypothetical protein